MRSLSPDHRASRTAPRVETLDGGLRRNDRNALSAGPINRGTANPQPRRLQTFALLFLSVATIHNSGAWFWPQNSTDSIVVEQIFGTEFKYIVYITYLVMAFVGIQDAVKRPDFIASVFFLQVATLLISAAAGGNVFYGAQALISVLGISFGAFATVRLLGQRRAINWIIGTFAVILAVSVLLSVLLPSVGTHTGLYFPGQWRGAFGHKNQLGFVAAMTLLLVLPTMNRRPAWLSITALSLALLCLVMARSGSSIILFAFGSAIFSAVVLMRKIRTPHLLIVLVVTIALLVAFLLKDYILALISVTLEKDRTFSGRTAIWQKMLELGSERPFFGHGPYYLAIDTQFLERARTALNFPQLRSAHNSYIENIIEFGYIGLILFMTPMFMIICRWLCNRLLQYDLYMIVISISPVLLYFTVESTNRIYTGVATLVINSLFCSRPAPNHRRLFDRRRARG